MSPRSVHEIEQDLHDLELQIEPLETFMASLHTHGKMAELKSSQTNQRLLPLLMKKKKLEQEKLEAQRRGAHNFDLVKFVVAIIGVSVAVLAFGRNLVMNNDRDITLIHHPETTVSPTLISVSSPQPRQVYPCQPEVGGTIIVVNPGRLGYVNLRSEPGNWDKDTIKTELYRGTQATVISGPRYARPISHNHTYHQEWWEIITANKETGWVAEYVITLLDDNEFPEGEYTERVYEYLEAPQLPGKKVYLIKGVCSF